MVSRYSQNRPSKSENILFKSQVGEIWRKDPVCVSADFQIHILILFSNGLSPVFLDTAQSSYFVFS